MNNAFSFANVPYALVAGVLLLSVGSGAGQPSSPGLPSAGSVGQPVPQGVFTPQFQPSAPVLSRFDLDFPGGTPKDLVAAIQEAMHRPLNAIIPDEFVNFKLPALKMKNVTVPQLFEALGATSVKTEINVQGSFNTIATIRYGFFTRSSPYTDDSIWYFHVEKPTPPPPPEQYCRFYSLAPYLDHGTTVDDITTAIETGWKMLGNSSPAEIRFHKDTKLLIAVGEQSKLEIIDAVLKALGPPPTNFGMPIPGSVPGSSSK